MKIHRSTKDVPLSRPPPFPKVFTFIFIRETENVIVSPSGSLLRLRSAVLEFTILDASLHLDERPEPLENIKSTIRNKQNLPTGSQEAVCPPTPQGDQLVLAVATEKGASCFALPSQRQIATYQVPDPATVIRASAVSWLGEKKCSPVLLFFTNDGKIKGKLYKSVIL